jgi:hypothetical protein
MPNSTNKNRPKGRTTAEFAAANLVKPESVIARLSRSGSYFGVRPDKLQNGRLRWPGDEPGETGAAK